MVMVELFLLLAVSVIDSVVNAAVTAAVIVVILKYLFRQPKKGRTNHW